MAETQKVGDLLALAWAKAIVGKSDIHQRWITGSFALANACGIVEIAVHLQEVGKLDVLIRAVEDETAANEPNVSKDLHFPAQMVLSRLWILGTYEALRTIRERWSDQESNIVELLRRVELVRIPVTKLRIAKDQKGLGSTSIELARHGDPPEKPSMTYTANGQINYWPGTLVNTGTGSIGWSVIDLQNKNQTEITRQELSDEMLALMTAM